MSVSSKDGWKWCQCRYLSSPSLNNSVDSIHVSLVVDSLDHLQRTGRISNTSAFFGNLLKIKPILTFDKNGKIVPEAKERTMKQALQHITDNINKTKFDQPMRISVVDANNPELSQSWVIAFREHFPQASISTYQISPAITVHTGDKAMGVFGIWTGINLASSLNKSEWIATRFFVAIRYVKFNQRFCHY